MASEIRVNSLSSRTGLSTVTFTDTGPIFSGITTFQDNSGFNVGTGGSIFSPASNTVTLGTNSAERLRIDSSGRLKVGTTNDIIWNQTSEDGVVIEQSGATQIVRNGDVPLLVTRNTSTGQIVKFSQAGTERGSILYDGDFGIASAGNLTFDISGTERLRITSAGNVSIGSLTDDSIGSTTTLTIDRSSGNGQISFAANGTVRGRIFADNSTSDFRIGNPTSNDLMLYTNNLERLRIDSGGNVNIKGGNLSVGLDSATLDFTDSNSNTKFVEVGAIGGDALFVAHSSAKGVGYFGYEAGGDRLVVACDNGSGANKIDFIVNAGTVTGGSTDNLNNVSPALRITGGGDLLLGGQTAYTYDDTGDSNTILDIANSNNNKRGILSLSGNSNANGPSIGTIWFNNDQNSGTGPGGTMKLVAAIQAKAVTSDSNAGDDSGAYLQFLTKPESAALAESMVIHSDGEVTKVKQPGFFTRRAVGGDGRAAQAQEWSVTGTGSFNTGNHFNASNGRFTAPVAGRYIFTAAPGYKQTSYDYNFKFLINGGQQSEPVRIIDGGDDLTSHSGFTGTVIYNLNANDYVQVEVGYIHHVNLTYNFFMGYLLG